MIITRVSLAVCLLVFLIPRAYAQNYDDVFEGDIFGRSIQRLGGYYTRPAQTYLRERIAADFAAGAPAAGFTPAQTQSVSRAIRFGQVNRVSGGAHGWVVTANRDAAFREGE